MCGIAGFVYKNKEVEEKCLRSMLKSMKHRGPDGEGFYIHENIALGMRRLAILDVKKGDQPFFNESRNLIMVGNGEIYNYIELRDELRSRGHIFRSNSDMEVIVHLFEEYGEKFIDHIVGMFAIALFDAKEKTMYLVRDRYGEKPIFFAQTENEIYFSSELKSLLTLYPEKKINKNAFKEAFLYNYIIEPITPFENIHKVPAGNFLKINIENLKIEKKQYFNFLDLNSSANPNLEDEIIEKLEKSCELCLRSDVPIGVSLSGGIDSSAILSLAANKNIDLTAFIIGYEGESSNDESFFAEQLCDKLNVNFIKKEIKTTDFVTEFPHLIYCLGEPIVDIASYGIWSVSKLARDNGVKVLLGGLGGDELFWGYPWVNDFAKTKIISTKHDLMASSSVYKRAVLFSKLFINRFDYQIKEPRYKKMIYSEEENAKIIISKLREEWLVSNCININDHLSMAASIEIRSPLLDINLSKLTLGSEENLLSYKLGNKVFLKEALRGILPEEVLNRKKRGFNPPVYNWLKQLIPSYFYLLEDGFLEKEGIIKLKKGLLNNYLYVNFPYFWFELYKLITLEIWGRLYVYGQKLKEIKPSKK